MRGDTPQVETIFRVVTERIEQGLIRPCAIVIAAQGTGGDAVTVTVAPITHSAPRNPKVAIEIPPKVEQHLSLDERRSWIVLDEFNEFAWPGFDLRPVPGKPGQYDYGVLPPALFTQIVHRVPNSGGRVKSSHSAVRQTEFSLDRRSLQSVFAHSEARVIRRVAFNRQ